MILISLKIKIKNFWACDISKRFPDVNFKIVDIHPFKENKNRVILDIKNLDSLNKLISFLKNRKEIENINILLDDNIKLISFYFSHGPLIIALIKSGVHIRPPLFLEDGYILVNLIGNEINIKNFLKESKNVRDIDIKLVKKSKLKYFQKSILTEKQENVLKNAITLGFYDVPRKISIRELAKKLKISGSTLSEHLRKAEEKIIKDYF